MPPVSDPTLEELREAYDEKVGAVYHGGFREQSEYDTVLEETDAAFAALKAKIEADALAEREAAVEELVKAARAWLDAPGIGSWAQRLAVSNALAALSQEVPDGD